MSLLHPTLGELIDRASLLGIKIRHGLEEKKPVAHFEAEMREITRRMKKRRAGEVDIVLLDEMVRIHEKMWFFVGQAENGVEVSSVHLQRLNRRRIDIREQIDKAIGDYKGPERL